MTITRVDTLADLARTRAQEFADKPVLIYGNRAISFADLDRRANRVANALRALGVKADDRIAYLDKNGPEFFDVLFGTAKIKAVMVPLNWRLAPPEMAYIINDALAPVLVVHEEFAPQLAAFASELQTVRHIFVIGRHERYPSFEEWLASAPDTDPDVPTGSDDVALQLYTSGTTGHPKGVMLTNGNLFTLLPSIGTILGLTADSVQLTVMPLFHIGGSGPAIGGIAAGCTTILQREVDPGAIMRAIAEHRVTNVFLVPAVIQFMLQHPASKTTDFSSLKIIAYGASPIPEDVLVGALQTFKCGFIQLYGMTETTGAVSMLAPEDHALEGEKRKRLRSCGRALPSAEIRIVDPATGEDRPLGEVGEVWVRSRQNMKGYWRNDPATAETITPDGWLRTGDAGYMDEEGYIYLYDRVKDMIVSGGENVYPAEVESALFSHPEIADVAVIGVPDPKWGEAVKAIVVRAPGSQITEQDVIAYARTRLAGYKVPKSVDFVESLPRNPSGKILKRELREPYWRGHERRIN